MWLPVSSTAWNRIEACQFSGAACRGTAPEPGNLAHAGFRFWVIHTVSSNPEFGKNTQNNCFITASFNYVFAKVSGCSCGLHVCHVLCVL